MTSSTVPPTVHTLGHGDRDIGEFVDSLTSFGVQIAVDVRKWPVSRRHPQFDRERLEASLARRGLRYRWLGDGLGGLRPEGFTAHMRSRAFADSFRKLVDLARESPVAVFCAERDPAGCHRRHIAQALEEAGFLVRHIEAPHRLFPVPGDAAGQSTLFPL
jgi:uncharacterized protein (DUF488 family)